MRIAVVGTGAMGSVYAAMFVEAGHDVVAVDIWSEHVEAINRDGLTLTGFSGDRTLAVAATTDVIDAADADLYVLATKANGVASAARSIAPQLAPGSLVVTIQNGLGARDRAVAHLPEDRLLLGVAQGFGASVAAPGRVHQNGMQQLRLGEPGGGMTDRLRTVERVWAEAGFPAKAYENIEQLIWEKFVCNVAIGAPCLISQLTVGELLADPAWRECATGCAQEAYDVALAKGIPMSYDDPVAYVEAFVARVPDAKPSMLQDHLAGRRSEVDAINGQVPIEGAKVGVPTPHNDDIVTRVRLLEAEL